MVIAAIILIILAVILFALAIFISFVKENSQPELLQNGIQSIAFVVEAIFLLLLAYILKTW